MTAEPARISTPLTRSASFIPTSVNNDDRTVEIVWTTGARSLQRDPEKGGFFLEELEISEAAVDLSRLASGAAPFLAMHRSDTLDGVLGVVETAWLDLEKYEGRARVRFATGDAQADRVWNLVAQGVVRNISVGYTVEKYEIRDIDGETVHRAVKWTPLELSAVTVPADAKATVRFSDAAATSPYGNQLTKETSAMNENPTPENPTPAPEAVASASEILDTDATVSRSAHVYALCEVAGLSIGFARNLAASTLSLDQIRKKIVAERAAAATSVSPVVSSVSASRRTLADAVKERFSKTRINKG